MASVTHEPRLSGEGDRAGGMQGMPRSAARVNVGDIERLLCFAGGGAVAAWGLRRGSLGGMFLAMLGGSLIYRGLSGHCGVYESLGVNTARRRGHTMPAGAGVKVDQTITVNRPRDEVYRFWRRLENLPSIMSHLQEVRALGGDRSRWTARGPLGTPVSWEAEIITEKPNEWISWRSLASSSVDTAGSVHFRPALGGRATEVRVVLKYDPPAGKVGDSVARLLGESPERMIRDDLRRFKERMESKGQEERRGESRHAGMRH